MSIFKKKHPYIIIICIAVGLSFCLKKNESRRDTGSSVSAVSIVESNDQLNSILQDSTGLQVLDFYADWCTPCKMVSPIMEELAAAYKNQIHFYKIDVDRHQDAAQKFNITGIPFVVFIQDKSIVGTLMGVQTKEEYEKVIRFFFNRKKDSASTGSQADQPVKTIDVQEAKEMVDRENPVILDVRTQQEYNDGHLEKSIHIPVGELPDRIAELNRYKDKEIIVYCRSGNRSLSASNTLIKKGFQKIFNMKKGIIGWRKKGFPVER